MTRGLCRGLWWRSRGLFSAQYRRFCLFTVLDRWKCRLCRGHRIVFKEHLNNETAMFTGPTHGVYWQLDDPPKPLPPPAPPYPTTSLPVTLRNVGVHSAAPCISRLSIDKVRKYITAHSFRYVYHLYLENTKIYRDVVCLVCLCNPTSTTHFCHQWTFRQLHSETVSLSTRTECIEKFLRSSTIKFH